MKITDKNFATDMADAFEEGLSTILDHQSDAFSFAYDGAPETGPAGVAEKMKCLVILMPEPLADLMQEGLVAVRDSLGQVLANTLAKPDATGVPQ